MSSILGIRLRKVPNSNLFSATRRAAAVISLNGQLCLFNLMQWKTPPKLNKINKINKIQALSAFVKWISSLTVGSAKVKSLSHNWLFIFTCDFNLHMDSSSADVRLLPGILVVFDLDQHVNFPTLIHGHSLGFTFFSRGCNILSLSTSD